MTCLLAQATLTPTSEPALDTTWRLQTSWHYAPWLTVVAVVGIVLLVGYCYAKELSPAGRGYRLLLGGLRLVTVALLLAMLSQMLLSGTRSGRPRFAVLVDHSGSMGVADPIAAEELPADLRPAIGNAETVKRLTLAKAVLESPRLAILERLAQDYDLQLYAAADDSQPLAVNESSNDRGSESDSQPSDAANLSSLAVDESATTRLGEALERIVNPASGRAPQGVLVLSDGQVTTGASLATAAESARRAATPLYLVGIGGKDPPPDVALTDLLAEEVVFVDDLVSFQATLRMTGAIAEPVRVTLRREGSDEVLAEQTISPGQEAQSIALLHRPEEPGDYRYVLSAEPAAGELSVANNGLRHEVAVRDQKVRVLLAAGGPSFEYRYLKHLLERDSTVDLASFLQEADIEYGSADPSAISRLPLREQELNEYDVVVLMDLDPRLAPRSFWPGLRWFVGERGGGLALVAGPRYLPGAYRDLADFAALYPADLQSAGVGEAITENGYRVAPTRLGLTQPALQLADDAAQTERVWRSLPELYWRAELGQPKPAAQVLAAHPTATAAAGGPAPLILSQYYGAGRVTLHAMDSTYRWRRRVGDVYFARYWVQTLRALARGRLAAGDAEAQLTVDRQRYQPGESVRLRLRTGAATEGEVAVLLQGDSGPQRRIVLAPSAEQGGVYEATLDRLPVGTYRVLPTEINAGPAAPSPAAFTVVAPPGEFSRLEVAAETMQAAAERSRGAYFGLAEIEKLAQALPQARRVPIETLPPIELWNRWWMLAAICGSLTAEWILRKRKAML